MKRLLFCLFLLATVHLAQAQYYKSDTARIKERNTSRLMIGGSAGLAFGDYTNIDFSPIIGLRFNEMFAAGVAINAQYGAEHFRYYDGSTQKRNQYTILGGGLWGRFYPFDFMFIHVQPEYNAISVKTTLYNPKQTYTDHYGVPSLLLGGGYVQPVSDRAAINIMALYDVVQDSRSPYSNGLILRVGATLGF
ncbi:hypothetical protein [Chitinophaga sancti]|uniref:Outer membrane protein beta-barrel domain-containing protein n=1 Tax=Chitinophaga sancti TaxID=1004 RepID=A0A1K1RES6_9BACT|nr:hypothetical protein [Chitinophaga sancti]WQD65691.1 hypothetical protein U0033_14920 [Chitinophaga sancti]WQG88687.1 hypothetical protein SR876_27550 [Chitinophaga sancti]SFW70372.1 hypothetical protein SAMN05661012_03700 [Chitinophaga sancti]